MGEIKQPQPVKLIVPMLAHEVRWFARAEQAMSARFGPADWHSALLPFEATAYYVAEMGAPQWRCFLTFAELIDPGELAQIKHVTNDIEQELALGGKRRVNLDPGYVSLAKLVLATTKNQWHRIYLGSGIYAEVTLSYQRGAWRPQPWTYPDYASAPYLALLMGVRQRYHAQVQSRLLDDQVDV
jgi:hypothetical protein